jgi:branched-chain amino acid aminotransferase
VVHPGAGKYFHPPRKKGSITELARDRNVKVSERKISIDEVFEEGKECFVSGTAAGAMPIESLTYQGKKVLFNNGKTGELTAEIRDTLKGIQYGIFCDTKGGLQFVDL